MGNAGSLTTLLSKGGIFIYPIIMCSVFGLAVFLHKLWYLRKNKVVPESFLKRFYDLLSKGNIKEARSLCLENGSSIARIGALALNHLYEDIHNVKSVIEEEGQKEVLDLGRYIEALGTISSVSTLLGLLGTISGMIKIFNVISTQTIVNPPTLAGGISEALYTTAFGLAVAIPTFIAYKYLSGRYEELVTFLEHETNRLMEIISSTYLEKSKNGRSQKD